jgi:phosphoglucosamine mutase
MSNLGLRRCVAAHEIEFVEVDVGDRNVVEELERRNLSIGGEQSGHIIFPDHATGGDGALTGAMLLDVVNGTGHSLGLLAGVMQKFPQVLRNVRVRSKPDLASLPAVAEASRRVEAELGDAGRLVLRYSGTEPLARVMIEGPEQAAIERLAGELAAAIEQEVGAA